MCDMNATTPRLYDPWAETLTEQAAWSLHGERRGEFRLIKVKDTNPRGYPLDKGFVALLRVAPSRLREHGFIKFADIYERYGVYGREIS